MLMQPSEIIDKAAILQVKANNGMPVTHALNEYMQEIEKGGYHKDWFRKMVSINTIMFEVENQISKSRDDAEVGRLYRRLRILTMKRVKIKNSITTRYGGHKEHKRY